MKELILEKKDRSSGNKKDLLDKQAAEKSQILSLACAVFSDGVSEWEILNTRANLCNSPHHRLKLRTHKYSWEHYPKNTTNTCGEETAQSKHETEMSRWARNAGDTGQMEDSKNCYELLGSTFPFGKARSVCFGT